jgi:Predicted signal transduction protein with a C-terminal ATPase domain
MRLAEKSIRTRIIVCVIAAIMLMGGCLIVTIRLNQRMLERIGGSYKTNAELTEFSTNLAEAERAMETYVEYHTFESIDSYYHFETLSDTSLSQFQMKPSTDKVMQKEYIVRQISETFFTYSRNVVSARRANNMTDVESWYGKSLRCYTMLQGEISQLNVLFMQKNAKLYNEYRDNYSFMMRLSIGFIFVFFMLILAVLFFSITSIMKPLADISTVALRVANRDFDVPLFNSTARDEIGNICRAFDRMIISIREYIDTIWEKALQETELREKELEMRELYADARLRALQNQINPHFLFNTLNTGVQLAMMEGADKTCFFMEQVADFFRYNIQQKNQTATIGEELSLVDNFVYIMKVRFGDRLQFKKNVPNEIAPRLLPRMTLQPLVENCIKHGLNGAKGIVVLTIESDSFFTKISISDNGCGFPPDLRRKILEAASSDSAADDPPVREKESEEGSSASTGTGLINVITRLRLYFHRNDVFDIVSGGTGNGTTFIIRIPNV